MSTLDPFGFDEPQQGANLSAKVTNCRTCSGDRYVTVRLRSPEQTQWMLEHQHRKGHQPKVNPREFHEEVAPCPDCNSGVTYDYWIMGQRVSNPDAAWVRQAIAQ